MIPTPKSELAIEHSVSAYKVSRHPYYSTDYGFKMSPSSHQVSCQFTVTVEAQGKIVSDIMTSSV
jgi:hypothetical protein